MGLELIEQVRELDGGTLDAILVPISGGGMAAGVALAARHASPTTKVFVVEPYGKNLTPALVANELTSTPGTLDTIADGMRSPNLGDLPFPIVAELAESRALPVTDEQIRAAMKLTIEQLKIVCEPSGATSLAAALQLETELGPNELRRVGVIVCGGNVDVGEAASLTSGL